MTELKLAKSILIFITFLHIYACTFYSNEYILPTREICFTNPVSCGSFRLYTTMNASSYTRRVLCVLVQQNVLSKIWKCDTSTSVSCISVRGANANTVPTLYSEISKLGCVEIVRVHQMQAAGGQICKLLRIRLYIPCAN